MKNPNCDIYIVITMNLNYSLARTNSCHRVCLNYRKSIKRLYLLYVCTYTHTFFDQNKHKICTIKLSHYRK